MASNIVQPGISIDITAPSGGVTSGVGVQIGTHLFGVANVTAAQGAAATITIEGVVTIAKTSALAISVGDALYWDSTNKVVNKTATAQKGVGIAVSAASNPSSTVLMKLVPSLVVNV